MKRSPKASHAVAWEDVGYMTQLLNTSKEVTRSMSDFGRMVPVFLVPTGRKVVVFGGGAVALRKCRHFEGFRI